MTSDVVLWDIKTLWSSAPCSHMLAVQWLGSTIYSLNHFPVQNSITNWFTLSYSMNAGLIKPWFGAQSWVCE